MQKTAYEMRISYWSSDVCSSDENSEAIEGFTTSDGGGGSASTGAWPKRPSVRFIPDSAFAGRRAISESMDSGRKAATSGIMTVVATAPSMNTDRQSPVAASNRDATRPPRKIGRAHV